MSSEVLRAARAVRLLVNQYVTKQHAKVTCEIRGMARSASFAAGRGVLWAEAIIMQCPLSTVFSVGEAPLTRLHTWRTGRFNECNCFVLTATSQA